jgi:hypothetical protein
MEKARQAPHFVIEHVPEQFGNMFIPAENMRGQASMGAGCEVFIIPPPAFRPRASESGISLSTIRIRDPIFLYVFGIS